MKNLWHYPRTDLAEQILNLFDTGLANSLIFFAPRRMGKTEFLCKDIQPLAKKLKWQTFYFSFLDAGGEIKSEFNRDLCVFAEEVGAVRLSPLGKRINKIGGELLGIRADFELREPRKLDLKIKDIMNSLAKNGKTLLLLDEVQVLALDPKNEQFIAALRTALDINKDDVKVIFTGSSQEGLRRMFSQAKAPFFHFGQNLPFPELDKRFIDHLIEAFKKATKRTLNKTQLWQAFVEMGKVPQLIRSLVERLALNPDLSMPLAKKELLAQVFNDRAYANIWQECSALERLILLELTKNNSNLFGSATREQMTKNLGIDKLAASTIQSSLKVLQRKMLIGHSNERGSYYISDPNFKNWLVAL